MTATTQHNTLEQLRSASKAYDYLFSNHVDEARREFETDPSPFHSMGLGFCAFLEAVLGMETGLMAEATRCLTLAEAGLEWEVVQADLIVLLGLTYALSESYTGYAQCLYALNKLNDDSAHSKFIKLYKTVFPNGIENGSTSGTNPSRKPSIQSINSTLSAASASKKPGLFKWRGSALSVPLAPAEPVEYIDGPIEDLIVSGTAFGFGLFNLMFSLMPSGVRGVAGFFGFKGDRKLALQALAVSATKKDTHSVFAGLVLMSYYGVVLLLLGYQADEENIIKQYRVLVDSIESRYPTGALWIVNRAKILRVLGDADGAIKALQAGLTPELPHSFAQADTLLVFELAWVLLSQRRYQESADMFLRMTGLNSWSHATYYYIAAGNITSVATRPDAHLKAAGCYFSLGNLGKAQELFDTIPGLLEKKKMGGKELPMEVFIKKRLLFYQEKQKRRKGGETRFVEAIRISPAEEIAMFWNVHNRISAQAATIHINEWSALTPTVSPKKPSAEAKAGDPVDLDCADELALRALLLGVVYRTKGDYASSRNFLSDAYRRHSALSSSTWIPGIASFEWAVLNLREAAALEKSQGDPAWDRALTSASSLLDQAVAVNVKPVDLASRLDSRITMLRDEIVAKRRTLGLA